MARALFIVAVTLTLTRIAVSQLAGLYSTTAEKNALEFASAYVNQQSTSDPSHHLIAVNISRAVTNETARRDAVCNTLSNVSGLIVPQLTELSDEAFQYTTLDTLLPIIVAQNTLTYATISDSVVIWRSIYNELLNVMQGFVNNVRPTAVVLIESSENVAFSLSAALPSMFSNNVNVTIIQYSDNRSLISEIENVANEIEDAILASAGNYSSSAVGAVFVLNSPIHDVDDALAMRYNTSLEYRWLLLPHLTAHLDNLMTTGEMLWLYPTITQGLQLDSLSTQEFTDFQNHWLSANKTMYPESNIDTSEFAYDVYKAVFTMLEAVNTSGSTNQAGFNCSSFAQMNVTYDDISLSPLPNGTVSLSSRNYTIWNITTADFTKFGRWSRDSGFERVGDGCSGLQNDEGGVSGTTNTTYQHDYSDVHFHIVTIEETPFVMNNSVTGELEGLCIDLLNILQVMLGFHYTIYLVEDGKFGAQSDGAWNGIIGDIIQERANLSVASLTITSDRISVIDFTKPYIELGTKIMLYKDPEEGFSMTRFARPFSAELIVVFVISWPVVGIVAWLTAWLSPYDRRALKKEKKVDAPYGFSYSIWTQYGSMMQQGSEYHPMSPSSRIVVATWWFVVLILISSYTAQLAASLTTESIARKINSINDLTSQDHVRYGTVNNSEVEQFFSSSNITTYRSALPTIRNNLYNTTKESVDEVCESKGTFAFIWDSIVLETFIGSQGDCELCLTSQLFDRKSYGIALPLNSSYTSDFTIAILKLRENQTLLQLRSKWIPTSSGSSCGASQNIRYSIVFMGDTFVVLLICIVISFLVLLFEIVWKYYKINQKFEDQLRGWKEIWKFQPRSNRTAPSDSYCHDKVSVAESGHELANGNAFTSSPEEGTTANGQLPADTFSVFVKQKESLHESESV